MSHRWLTAPGFKLAPEARRKAVRLLGLAAALLVLSVSLGLGRAAVSVWQSPTEDPKALEAAFQALAAAFHLVVGVAKGPLVLALTCFQFLFLDRTEIGRRLWHWAMGEGKGPTDAKVVQTLAGQCAAGLDLHQLVTTARDMVQPYHEDPEGVPAAKTLSAGLAFAALLVVNAALLGAFR